MRIGVHMQKQVQLAFTGYDNKDVELTLKKIMKKLSDPKSDLKISTHGNPEYHDEPLANQPPLHGCNHQNVTIVSLSVSGSLKNIKRLVEIKTPDGVMVEILPQTA